MIRERSGEVEMCSASAPTSIETRSGDGPLFECDGSFGMDWRDRIFGSGDPETLKQEQCVGGRPLPASKVCDGFLASSRYFLVCNTNSHSAGWVASTSTLC